MIARWLILLPRDIYMPLEDAFEPITLEFGEHLVTVWPLLQANISAGDLAWPHETPAVEAILGLHAVEPTASPAAVIGGSPTFRANLLVLDFLRQEFDLSQAPAVDAALQLANWLLASLASTAGARLMDWLDPDRTPWRLAYLTDDNKPAPSAEQRPNFRARVPMSAGPALTAADWETIGKAPIHLWNMLILDAKACAPSDDTGIILAYSALEVFIAWALEQYVASGAMDRSLFKWITDRGNYAKDPSLPEQFDQLLKAVSGRTLKSEKTLWEGFQLLRKARNDLVHTGEARINGKPLEPRQARWFVQIAADVIDWVEQGLPEDLRRPARARTPVAYRVQAVSPGQGANWRVHLDPSLADPNRLTSDDAPKAIQ